MFNFLLNGKKDKELRKTLTAAYDIGFKTGAKLTACGIESILFRVKMIDTWDKNLKEEIVFICESILKVKDSSR